jgi:hypothetical protein
MMIADSAEERLDDSRQPMLDAARLILKAADAAGIPTRAAGGVGVALSCPSASRPPLRRCYGDVDLVVRRKHVGKLERLLLELGHRSDTEMNALFGGERLHFVDADGRMIDVFVDTIRGCHDVALKARLEKHEMTLAPADLALTKLQIVKTTEKDFLDLIALFTDWELSDDDTGINVRYLAGLCGADWGLWRTVTEVGGSTAVVASRLDDIPESTVSRVKQFCATMDAAPKSMRWKARARVGDRVRWYEDPEDVER